MGAAATPAVGAEEAGAGGESSADRSSCGSAARESLRDRAVLLAAAVVAVVAGAGWRVNMGRWLGREWMRVSAAGGVLRIESGGGFESRNDAVAAMCREAWAGLTAEVGSGVAAWTGEFTVFTGDTFSPAADYSMAVPATAAARCFPSFIYGGYPETGVPDFTAAAVAMAAAGSAPAVWQQAGWVGAVTHPSRAGVVAWSAAHPHLANFTFMSWGPKTSAATNPAYIPMPAQASAFRVLADLRGWGFSGRLPLLLHAGRPVIIQGRPDEQAFLWDMEPWVHYIPASSNGTDVGAAVEWTFAHADAAAAIGAAGAAYARAHLTHAAATRTIADIMIRRFASDAYTPVLVPGASRPAA